VGRRGLAAFAIVLCVAAASAAPAPLAAQRIGADGSLVVGALRVLEQDYVKPVNPVELLNIAIHSLEQTAHLGPAALPEIPSDTSEVRAIRTFQAAFSQAAWATHIPARELAYAALHTMLATLHDSHVSYLDPTQFRETQKELTGQAGYEGIGVLFASRRAAAGDTEVFVRDVFPGSPAAAAGLRKFDRITQVNGVSLSDASSEDAMKAIRGPTGSLVNLHIQRGPRSLTTFLFRRPIQISPVRVVMIRPGVAYIRIIEFSSGASDQLRKSLRLLVARGPIDAAILDLRWNRGGILSEAESVAGIFLPPRTTLGHIFGRGQVRRTIRTTGTPLLPKAHLAVLMDRGSASSSEVVAQGLLASHRATIIGERSAGAVGLARTAALPAGAMRVTVYQVMGPEFEQLEGIGVTPHIPVALTLTDMERGVDTQLEAALIFRGLSPHPDPSQ
jgi:carboxyl-terminal processing protease